MASSALGLAAKTVGRRSKRLLAIRELSSVSDGSVVVLSTSAIGDENPLRESKSDNAVPITPSPAKKKKKATTTQQSSGSKRRTLDKRATIIPETPIVSRRLDLEHDTTAIVASPSGVENNDLELTTDMVAAINPLQKFIDLEIPPEELRPSNTLTTGQCFHWRMVHPIKEAEEQTSSDSTQTSSAWGTHDATEWVGTLRLRLLDCTESVVLVVRELPETTLYRPLARTRRRVDNKNTTENDEMEELDKAVRDYFQLDVSLPRLYKEWSGACTRFASIAECIPGVRVIRQDPWECLVSFICSSNNNIPRITKMLANIRREYGQPLLQIPACGDGEALEYYQIYSFPSLEELTLRATDKDLRGKCGMGYRANYILETMKLLQGKGGEPYLRDVLRNTKDSSEVQNGLCEFKGVGKKVADCVALFSLNQYEAIPVDTHVWNIAIRDYDPDGSLKTTVKSLTPTNYRKVGELFRSRFPNKAGWAHSLLFVAELPSFRGLLPKSLVEEMDAFQQEEKERKKQQKKQKS